MLMPAKYCKCLSGSRNPFAKFFALSAQDDAIDKPGDSYRLDSDPPEKDTEFQDVVKDLPTHVLSRYIVGKGGRMKVRYYWS